MNKSQTVYIALGANLGNPVETIKKAILKLEQGLNSKVQVAGLYQNEAVGFESTNVFVNTVCSFKTDIPPMKLMSITQGIEKELGRDSKQITGYENREIDLDIILYGDLIFKEENLIIPHPKFSERDFVLIPLNDLNSNLIDPVTKLSINQHIKLLSSDRKLVKINF
ncbi:MAG: 2-amino-4-hydroxy-6-hydroxymethyldihydropteridine diphosphokinase [Lentimonas sp.]|jgi:2-amino-4-hydroxy-6-hydroxymethyldihydropteridine diphosphokinase